MRFTILVFVITAFTLDEGNGQAFGFGGNVGPSGLFPQIFPQPNFNNFFNEYFETFKRFNQQLANNQFSSFAYSITNANSNSSVHAKSSLTYNAGYQQRPEQQQNVFQPGSLPFTGGFPNNGNMGGFVNGFGGGASSSAAIGPGGHHQTASIFPQNPTNPNVENFAISSPTGGSSFGSVFTSSQSGSSNINGKPTSFQQATTTINDNGKITSFTVQNP